MSISLGCIAPDFSAESTAGPLNLHDYIGDGWCVFFSYPRDFSAVCMTELGLVARLQPELQARNAKALALSIGELQKHHAWSTDFAAGQGCELNFPLVADPDGAIAARYGMVHPEHAAGITSRCLFIIGPEHKIRMYAMYPTGVGRNFAEVLRILDALQLGAKHTLVTPANWQPGEPAVIPPTVSDEVARERFAQGFDARTPYLRFVRPP